MTTPPLPAPDRHGCYRFPDGAMVIPSLLLPGTWLAVRPGGTVLRGGPDRAGHWDSPGEAAAALADCGEGPAHAEAA
jgi:hypothetical protein